MPRETKPESLELLAFVAIVVAKIWVVQSVALGGAGAVAMVLDLLFVFAVFATTDLLFARFRLQSFLFVDAAASVLLAAVAVYHAYYGLLPSRESLAMLGQATAVGGGIMTLIGPFHLLLFADIPVVIAVALLLRIRRRAVRAKTGSGADLSSGEPSRRVYQPRGVYIAAGAAVAIVVIGALVTSATALARDPRTVASERGIGSYIVVSLAKVRAGASDAQGVQVSDLQKKIDTLAQRRIGAALDGFTPGQARRMNVIVIQVEALQSMAVGRTIDGKAVTPNLDSLIEESWYYPNCVSGAGVGTTADVEFVTNTSLYPPNEVGASLGWSDRQLTSIPRILNEQGYESYTFHTNESGFWNRSQFYPAIGFTRYFDRTYFGTDDKMAFGSASDHVLYEKTVPQLKKAAEAKKPFYADVITMSSHFPFRNVPDDRRKLRPGGPYAGTTTGDYLTEINYVDTEIGYFFSQLKQAGLWDNSMVIVTGDHFGLPEPSNEREAKALRTLVGHDYNKADKLLMPLIIHLPGQTAGSRVETPVGHIDVAPTIADALGVDLSGMVRFGRSVLRSGDGIILAGNLVGLGAYVDESVICIPGPTFERSDVFDVRTRERLAISSASKAKLTAVEALPALSRQYVSTLPLRKDFDPNAVITFPLKK